MQCIYLRGSCLGCARDGWSCLLLSPACGQADDTFQGVLLLFYPQNTWMVPEYLSPSWGVRRWCYLCSSEEMELGALHVPLMPAGRARAGSWVEQVFVYTVWGTTVVLLIPALAGVPAASGRWQLGGAGWERGRHCCISQPRSMPLCLLFQIFTPPREPRDGGAAGTGFTVWGTTPGLQGYPQSSIILAPTCPLASHCGGGTWRGSGRQFGLGPWPRYTGHVSGESAGPGRLTVPRMTQVFIPLLHPNASHVRLLGWETWHHRLRGAQAMGCSHLLPLLPFPEAQPLRAVEFGPPSYL